MFLLSYFGINKYYSSFSKVEYSFCILNSLELLQETGARVLHHK